MAGVIGALPGVLGSLAAMEVIKLITGAGEPLIGRLLMVDTLGMRFETVRYRRRLRMFDRIETEALRALCDIAERYDAAAKPSGAGGGDCGIGLVGAGGSRRDILREWETHDIRRLRLAVHPAEGGVDDR